MIQPGANGVIYYKKNINFLQHTANEICTMQYLREQEIVRHSNNDELLTDLMQHC